MLAKNNQLLGLNQWWKNRGCIQYYHDW